MYMYSKNFLTEKKLIIQSTQTASPNMLLQKYQGIGERHPQNHVFQKLLNQEKADKQTSTNMDYEPVQHKRRL